MRKMKIGAILGLSALVCLSCGVAAVSASASEPTSTTAFEMVSGASIRYSDPSGIRFKVKLGQTEYASLVSDGAYKDGKTLKATIAPYDVVSSLELNDTNLASLNGKGEVTVDPQTIHVGNPANGEDASYYYANVVLGTVQYHNLGRELCAFAYIDDGVEDTPHTFTAKSETRNVAYVAAATLADAEETKTSKQEAMLNDFIHLALSYEANVPEDDAKSATEKKTVSVEMSATAVVDVGEPVTLTATPNTSIVMPSAWTSDNTAVATVENGVVTGVTKGTANITYTYGTATVTCAVTVTDIAAGLADANTNWATADYASFWTNDMKTEHATYDSVEEGLVMPVWSGNNSGENKKKMIVLSEKVVQAATEAGYTKVTLQLRNSADGAPYWQIFRATTENKIASNDGNAAVETITIEVKLSDLQNQQMLIFGNAQVQDWNIWLLSCVFSK